MRARSLPGLSRQEFQFFWSCFTLLLRKEWHDIVRLSRGHREVGLPELPDIVVYIEALEKRILGQTLEVVRVASPFLLRTASPPLGSANGKKVLQLRRLGKRICIGLEEDLWLVLHLMIAGRLHWHPRGVKVSRPRGLAAFDFPNGSILWTEEGSQKRASLHVVSGEAGLRALDPGGIEVLECDPSQFAAALL